MRVVPDRSKVQVRTRNLPKHFRHVVSDSFYNTYIKYIYIGFRIRLHLEKASIFLCPICTVDSRYLEIEGTLKNSSRYPYFDISDL